MDDRTKVDLNKNPKLAENVIRKYISSNREKFILFSSKIKNEKSYKSIIKMSNKELLQSNFADTCVEVFFNLPIENKNRLVFLFDHIIHINA